jgi:hypothetical protein
VKPGRLLAAASLTGAVAVVWRVVWPAFTSRRRRLALMPVGVTRSGHLSMMKSLRSSRLRRLAMMEDRRVQPWKYTPIQALQPPVHQP